MPKPGPHFNAPPDACRAGSGRPAAPLGRCRIPRRFRTPRAGPGAAEARPQTPPRHREIASMPGGRPQCRGRRCRSGASLPQSCAGIQSTPPRRFSLGPVSAVIAASNREGRRGSRRRRGGSRLARTRGRSIGWGAGWRFGSGAAPSDGPCGRIGGRARRARRRRHPAGPPFALCRGGPGHGDPDPDRKMAQPESGWL